MARVRLVDRFPSGSGGLRLALAWPARLRGAASEGRVVQYGLCRYRDGALARKRHTLTPRMPVDVMQIDHAVSGGGVLPADEQARAVCSVECTALACV